MKLDRTGLAQIYYARGDRRLRRSLKRETLGLAPRHVTYTIWF